MVKQSFVKWTSHLKRCVFSNIVTDAHIRLGLYFHFSFHFKYSLPVLMLKLCCLCDTSRLAALCVYFNAASVEML